MHMRNLLLCAIAGTALALAGCEASPQHPKHHHKYSRIYEGSDGHYYARTYDGSNFWFWMYVMDSGSSPSPSSSSSASSSYFSSGTWTRVSTPSSGLTPTRFAVGESKDGKPSEEVEEAEAVPENEMIEEQTTEAQAEAVEAAEATADAADAASSSSGSESSSDSGGSSGGGGDGGGDGGSSSE